jgi:uncharacterized peroxidase-related enzyme
VFDYRECGFGLVDQAMCAYAVKLTLTPGEVGQSDVDELREVGLSDEQITVAVQVISYFNYINRVADGLGVDQEAWMKISHDEWIRKKPNWRI